MGGAELDISALGVRVRVDLESIGDPASRHSLNGLWQDAAFTGNEAEPRHARLRALISGPSGPGPTDSPTPDPSVPQKDDVVAGDLRGLAAALSSRVTLAAIEAQKSDLVMLHACGVATPDGAVYAFVGPSGRGKTTLAAALGREYGYVSDETIGVREDGTVTPYRKPLSVIEPGIAPGKTQKAPADLGLLPLPDQPLRIAAITLIDRDAEREGSTEIVETGMVESITAIIPELSYLPHLSRPLQRLAGLFDAIGGVRRLTYREASTVAALVPTLRRPARQQASWRVVAAGEVHQTASTGQYARVPPLDAIATEGAYVVLHGSDVRVLDGIGPAIWDALASPASLYDIVALVVSAVGEPGAGDPTVLVETALLELIDVGIVARGPESRQSGGEPA